MVKKTVKAEKPVKPVKTTGKATDAKAKKLVSFEIEAGIGKRVCVAGSFNDWDPETKELADRKKTGVYSGCIRLAPGVYEYKFVVDGEWRLDDRNSEFAPNDLGTLNSVLVVK